VALAQREGCSAQCIGAWKRGALPAELSTHTRTIAEWAEKNSLDGVVWTALHARFAGADGRVPTSDEALEYFRGLTADVKKKAEEYVRKAPTAISTPYRKVFERELDWIPNA
jgi:hypothetical protein